jgi:hypothetical protein
MSITNPEFNSDAVWNAIVAMLELLPRDEAFSAITYWLRDHDESDATDLIAQILTECLQ